MGIVRIAAEFRIDLDKAAKIGAILLTYPVSMPEYIIPANLVRGSKEHALYLTYIISIDYMTDAEKLWRNARGAYQLSPEMFRPETILQRGDRTLQAFLRKLGARFSPAAAQTWKKISKVLLSEYNGDPRNITPQTMTIHEIKERLQELPYLRGPKLLNFYIRVMGETKLFRIGNLDELDVPVDKQVARFTAYTGVIKLQGKRFQGCANDDPLRSIIQEAWRNAAKDLGTAPWKLDEPMWTIGSKLCTNRKCQGCPVEDHCDKTRGITFKDNMMIWESL